MLNKIKPVAALSLICIVTVLALAVINLFTAPAIEEYQIQKTQTALKEVTGEKDVKFSEINTEGFPKEITNIFKLENGGYAFKVTVSGFNPGMVILCAISSEGIMTGATCLESGETKKVEKNRGESYINKTIDSYTDVDVITGSTETCVGYEEAIRIAFEAFEKLKEGEN